MANEHLGEAPITLSGKTYTLRLTTNRLAHLERMLDCRGGLPSRLTAAGCDTVRAVLYACLALTTSKGETALIDQPFSLDDMGDLIDKAGGLLKKGPVSIAYYELLAAGGIVDRTDAEKLGLIPPRPGPKPDGVEGPGAVPAEAVLIAGI